MGLTSMEFEPRLKVWGLCSLNVFGSVQEMMAMKRNLVISVAIVWLLLCGLATVATATGPNPQESQTVYNSKCPGDKDDDCKD